MKQINFIASHVLVLLLGLIVGSSIEGAGGQVCRATVVCCEMYAPYADATAQTYASTYA
jgi:hypothetical protein